MYSYSWLSTAIVVVYKVSFFKNPRVQTAIRIAIKSIIPPKKCSSKNLFKFFWKWAERQKNNLLTSAGVMTTKQTNDNKEKLTIQINNKSEHNRPAMMMMMMTVMYTLPDSCRPIQHTSNCSTTTTTTILCAIQNFIVTRLSSLTQG